MTNGKKENFFDRFFQKNIYIHTLTIGGLNFLCMIVLFLIPQLIIYRRWIFLIINIVLLFIFWKFSWKEKNKSPVSQNQKNANELTLKEYYSQKQSKDGQWLTEKVFYPIIILLVAYNLFLYRMPFINTNLLDDWVYFQLFPISLAIILCLFYFKIFIRTYNIFYEDAIKDKYYWLKVWNYLYFREEAENLKKQNQYLKSFTIFFKNTGSISTNDVAKVESELATLSYEQLKHLRYMKTVPSYIDDIDFSLNVLKKIVKD